MKKLLKYSLILVFAVTSTAAFSQTVKKKKKDILVDGVVCLKIERDLAANMTILKSKTGDEVVRIRYKTRNTLQGEDTYQVITFVESGQTFSTTSYIFTAAKLVEKLISNKAFSSCMIIDDKLTYFVEKYDEGVE